MARPGRVSVVGLGPGRPGLVTREALEALEQAAVCWLRTSRHPSAGLADAAPKGARSFDHLYEASATLEEVYAGIVEALVSSAAAEGEVVYAVPGSPSVAERSVELLRADERVVTKVLPGVSFADLAYERLGVDPLSAGVRIVDGHRFAAQAAGARGPFLVAQCDSPLVLSEVKLAIGAALDALPRPEAVVTVLRHLGLDDEAVSEVPWEELDRVVAADHLTSLWVPGLGVAFAPEMVALEELARTLRARCPWDRQQTHQSLTRYLIEESYEALEAIEELEPGGAVGYEHLEEELGDVLFQVVFHSVLAAEEGEFSLADVARAVHDKLVSRHPHVFGDVDAKTPEDVVRNWEQIKRGERGRSGAMDGVPRSLPALLYAHKVQVRAASVGFDWDSAAGPMDKVAEELGELAAVLGAAAGAGPEGAKTAPGAGEELGDLLFAVVNVARHLKLDPEAALREATAKFRRRFESVEALAESRGLDLVRLAPAAADRLWEEVKATEAALG
ncbi:MAG: nucleoside triphosphate pyrophosphohydrolase [Acidimicrobiales bacterium]